VSGLAAFSNVLYIGDNHDQKCYRAYPLPYLTTKTTYLSYTGIYATRDIAFEGSYDGTGSIWVANGFPGTPVRAFNTSGQWVDGLTSSDVPSAYGLAFDDEGFLWVSSLSDASIYQVNVFETNLDQTSWGAIKALSQ
jgi:hypothetical protein